MCLFQDPGEYDLPYILHNVLRDYLDFSFLRVASILLYNHSDGVLRAYNEIEFTTIMYEYHFGFFYSSMFSPYTHFYTLENILKGLETCPLRMEIEARRKDPDITRAFFIKDEI